MNLAEILATIKHLAVVNLCLDSRAVSAGDLFVVIPRQLAASKIYIEQAVANGAIAILIDEKLDLGDFAVKIPILKCVALAQNLGKLAIGFYGDVARKLDLIAVTGTNGKTSCVEYITQILTENNIPAAALGTLGVSCDKKTQQLEQHIAMTTPDCLTLFKYLAELINLKIKVVALEVSSHALAQQNRITGLAFDTVVFTNFSHDHLDYHGTLPMYWQAKMKLFTDFEFRHAVINVSNSYGLSIIKQLPKNTEIITYSLFDTSNNPMLFVENIEYLSVGMSARINTPVGTIEKFVPWYGSFHLENFLASLGACYCSGVSFEAGLLSLESLKPPAGRMETIQYPDMPMVIVDYAHTPEALSRALQSVREHCMGSLWCVFGCGGERDRVKRPQMLKIASKYADSVVVTADNPRCEPVEQIVNDMLSDTVAKHNLHIELDRGLAIKYAINNSTKYDMILVAGKGHENYQLIGNKQHAFSDKQIATETIRGIIEEKNRSTNCIP